jgi:hypothetical protein
MFKAQHDEFYKVNENNFALGQQDYLTAKITAKTETHTCISTFKQQILSLKNSEPLRQ